MVFIFEILFIKMQFHKTNQTFSHRREIKNAARRKDIIPTSAAASSLQVLLSCNYHTTFQSLCKVG